MTLVEASHGGELLGVEDFFAPVSFTLFGSLMEQYSATRRRLEALAAAVRSSACEGVLGYFVEANCPEQRQSVPKTVDTLFALAPAGRLVAVLPASARGKSLVPGFNAVWSDVLHNRFAGTTVDVAIVTLTRSQA